MSYNEFSYGDGYNDARFRESSDAEVSDRYRYDYEYKSGFDKCKQDLKDAAELDAKNKELKEKWAKERQESLGGDGYATSEGIVGIFWFVIFCNSWYHWGFIYSFLIFSALRICWMFRSEITRFILREIKEL